MKKAILIKEAKFQQDCIITEADEELHVRDRGCRYADVARFNKHFPVGELVILELLPQAHVIYPKERWQKV